MDVIIMIKDDFGLRMIYRYKENFCQERNHGNHTNHINHSSDNVVIQKETTMKQLPQKLTLISYLIVAIFFVFCYQDPISKEWKEERDKKQEERDTIIGIVILAHLPPFPVSVPCKVDCPSYNYGSNGLPFGDFNLIINGQANTSYSKTITSTAFTTTVSLSTAISEKNKFYNLYINSDFKDYDSYRLYNRISDDIYSQVYKVGKNSLLKYDGDKQVEIYSESIYTLSNPSTPPNLANSEIYLKLTNLSSSELGQVITLNSTDTSRYFEITFQGVRYSTKYTNSAISLTLASVPFPANTALLTIHSGTLKSSNSSSLESISISGTMTVYRQ